jgi:hypothetical protein
MSMQRRHFLQAGAVGLGAGVSGIFNSLVTAGDNDPKRKRQCILLWMNGGPATIDLWDVKPDHENGGPTKEIKTNAPGLMFSEHLPQVAKFGDRMAVLRGMSTKEGDHSRATYLMRTGVLPVSGIQFPSIGGLMSKELGDPKAELPNAVSIAPQRFFNNDAFGPGFLGPNHAPLMVGDNVFQQQGQQLDVDATLKVQNLDRPTDVSKEHADARMELLRQMQADFAASRPGSISAAHSAAYDRATRLMQSDAGKVFDLSQEKEGVRDKYGRTLFGQGCLLARRLIEKGVAFVEVNLGNWDTHNENFTGVARLCETMDKAWAALMGDLKDRGLLDSTLIIWMGEFGRTPKINGSKGRDHWPNSWATVLSGGGIKGGQAVGKTSKDGTTVEERPTSTSDLMATACAALGIDHTKQNMSNVGRPIPLAEKGATVVKEVVA